MQQGFDSETDIEDTLVLTLTHYHTIVTIISYSYCMIANIINDHDGRRKDLSSYIPVVRHVTPASSL